MNTLKVAVVMGGYSPEAEISLQSGRTVCEALADTSFEVYAIEITKTGWFYLDGKSKIPVSKEAFTFTKRDGRTIKPDVVFNTIHGTPGEDGLLSAYWELLEIPHTGPGFYAAALSFNKRDCLAVLKAFGVPCAHAYYINKGDHVMASTIEAVTGMPCFVKPSRSGSSFGVSKVTHAKELPKAIAHALEFDSQILVEAALVGPEISVGVFQEGGKIQALPPTEIVTKNDFFDYNAKYKGESEEITPARLPADLTLKVQQQAILIYELLEMKGVTRTDFIIQNGVPHFIEINTTPGLSKESIIPQQLKTAGHTLSSFFAAQIQAVL